MLCCVQSGSLILTTAEVDRNWGSPVMPHSCEFSAPQLIGVSTANARSQWHPIPSGLAWWFEKGRRERAASQESWRPLDDPNTQMQNLYLWIQSMDFPWAQRNAGWTAKTLPARQSWHCCLQPHFAIIKDDAQGDNNFMCGGSDSKSNLLYFSLFCLAPGFKNLPQG